MMTATPQMAAARADIVTERADIMAAWRHGVGNFDRFSEKEIMASRMLEILIVFKVGNHCQPNVGNFDRFAKKGIIASRMLEILIVFQRRQSLSAECWKF